MKTTALAILNTQQIVCLNGASTSHQLAGTNAAFSTCFTGPGTQLVLPQHGLSGWTGMQDAHNAPSCISLLLLGTSAGCSSTAQGSTLLSQPSLASQPRDPCSLQLAWALVSPTKTGEYKGGRGREGTCLPWQVILSSPLRQ